MEQSCTPIPADRLFLLFIIAVQSPCERQTSCLLRICIDDRLNRDCVYALYRANVISTQGDYSHHRSQGSVSMPCIGQTSFLHSRCILSSEISEIVCQCPVSGKRPFYIKMTKKYKVLWGVSMPCIGQTSFLPITIYSDLRWYSCVNALYRANVISTIEKLAKTYTLIECQCPVSGKRHFYPTPSEPSIYAGLRNCFCTYFSELSDFRVQ